MIKIEINTENNTFHPYEDEEDNRIAMSQELRDIFNLICAQIELEGKTSGKIADSDDKLVGHWQIT